MVLFTDIVENKGYIYVSPFGDENEQLSIKITLRKSYL